MTRQRLKIWELALLGALCFSLCVGAWAQGRQSEISSSLVRLHVIAVSDAPAEQELKLRVRDAVLEYISPLLDSVDTPADAKAVISAELDGIRNAAYSASEGRKVSVELGREYYPTREYSGFTLPAGEYDSLKVTLGSGQGHNWWCVVFPPLCISAAEQSKALETMSPGERGLITEADGYEIRLAIVELWGEITKALGI